MLKLEVGKTYISTIGNNYKIVADNCKELLNPFFGIQLKNGKVVCHNQFRPDGVSHHGYETLVKEWKEPVVHKRIICWYRKKSDYVQESYPFICVGKTEEAVRYYCAAYNFQVLKLETIEYME